MYNNSKTELLKFILDAITALPKANVDFLVLNTLIFFVYTKIKYYR
jgi:hypothetical protein